MGQSLRRLARRFVPPGWRPWLRRIVGPGAVLSLVALVALVAAAVTVGVGLTIAAGGHAGTGLTVAAAGLTLAATVPVVARQRRRRHAHALARAEDLLATGGDLPAALAVVAARTLADRDPTRAVALLAPHGLAAADRRTLRRLWTELERRGYLGDALRVADAVLSDRDRDGHRRREHLRAKLAVLSGAVTPTVAPVMDYTPQPGRVLHLVGQSLPTAQTGYTLRTHYTARAQAAEGLDPHVVTQLGFGGDGEVDGVAYHRLAGPVRGSVPLDVWLQAHVDAVAGLVGTLRPAVLHAASDYLNAITATVVGAAYGIPTVYESRGFWEETWLSRQAATFHWDVERLAATSSLPDEYHLRRDIEDAYRRRADAVVTLSEPMADRIVAGGVDRSRVTVVGNAVDPAAFPVLTRDRDLAARLGIEDTTTVVGYISSVKEYEGIDTLVTAVARLRAAAAGPPVRLLVVGDGDRREALIRQATELGLTDAIFTGRVPHRDVLSYYSLIDVFVVPRRPVEVSHLVTPLKPFEALSTGRTVVLSNVRALAAIADQSRAAALFEAGDPDSLAEVLRDLLDDPDRRRHLADAGAAWVRSHGSWAGNARAYQRLYATLLEQVKRSGDGTD